MLTRQSRDELRSAWLPNITDGGLDRLIELLEANSPLLIHGCFTRAIPMGCLATHIAWHHPQTTHLTEDAGIQWLARIAGLNAATSQVLREWDGSGPYGLEVRGELLGLFREEKQRRAAARPDPVPELAPV
jgi:hypothetical protein